MLKHLITLPNMQLFVLLIPDSCSISFFSIMRRARSHGGELLSTSVADPVCCKTFFTCVPPKLYTGQATVELKTFQRIYGVDPSSNMIETARHQRASSGYPGQLEFVQSRAEELPFLEDGSVDIITSGA